MDELEFHFIRASGPGGQNVNKVASAVQLRYNVRNSELPAAVKQRLYKLAGKKISQDGVLTLESSRLRTQLQNRQDVIDRFIQLVRSAAQKPKPRKKTAPSAEAKRKRLEAKRHRSKLKESRRKVSPD